MGRPREVTDEQIVGAARRCFLERGAAVSAAEIAAGLGVSHTTIFNRFGSKEGLMLAALGPPAAIDWVAALEAGPDERPVRAQLVEHARVMSDFFRDLHAGFGVLRAAGIDPGKTHCPRTGGSAPAQAYRALVGWIDRAQRAGRMARCDGDMLASTILGALQGWALTATVCGGSTSRFAGDRYVEGLVELLWNGIGDAGGSSSPSRPPRKRRSVGSPRQRKR